MSIKRINQFQAQEAKGEDLFEFLQSILPLITGSQGCFSCELMRDVDNPLSFVILEEWDSIESHQNSAQNIPPKKLKAAMSLLSAPPTGHYYQIE